MRLSAPSTRASPVPKYTSARCALHQLFRCIALRLYKTHLQRTFKVQCRFSSNFQLRTEEALNDENTRMREKKNPMQDLFEVFSNEKQDNMGYILWKQKLLE